MHLLLTEDRITLKEMKHWKYSCMLAHDSKHRPWLCWSLLGQFTNMLFQEESSCVRAYVASWCRLVWSERGRANMKRCVGELAKLYADGWTPGNSLSWPDYESGDKHANWRTRSYMKDVEVLPDCRLWLVRWAANETWDQGKSTHSLSDRTLDVETVECATYIRSGCRAASHLI